MEKYFALINNNLIEAIIVADDDFIKHIKDKYDIILDVTNNRPHLGDSYYPETKMFISNSNNSPEISVDLSAEHLQKGTESGFEPFNLSKYSVKYENGMVIIGCKHYPAAGFMDALHKVLIEKENTVHCFQTLDDGPAHGKFGITWDDAQKLYDALSKVKI